jgi:hypothetical protein
MSRDMLPPPRSVSASIEIPVLDLGGGPSDTRGAAFGWLALGVQFGTALSPLATGGQAALSLPGAFVFDGALAWVAAALLLFAGRR